MTAVRRIPHAAKAYLEHEWSRGISPSVSRKAYNLLTRKKYSEVHKKGFASPLSDAVYRNRPVSSDELRRAYDRWRVKARRDLVRDVPSIEREQKYGEGGRNARRAEKRSVYLVRKQVAEEEGLETLIPDPDHARDAGLLYSLTGEEEYREQFEEGSPT